MIIESTIKQLTLNDPKEVLHAWNNSGTDAVVVIGFDVEEALGQFSQQELEQELERRERAFKRSTL